MKKIVPKLILAGLGLALVGLLLVSMPDPPWSLRSNPQFSAEERRLVLLPVEGCETKDPEAIGTARMADVLFTSRCGSFTDYSRQQRVTSLIWQQTYHADGQLYRPDYKSKTQPVTAFRVYVVFSPINTSTPAQMATVDQGASTQLSSPYVPKGEHLIEVPMPRAMMGRTTASMLCRSPPEGKVLQCRTRVNVSPRVSALIAVHPHFDHELSPNDLERAVRDSLIITAIVTD